ncbi:hypothetical protein [Streptomyces sp. CS057]|uniref:hypothetical protein n=1 Tax=Streptomyces sp. CS057 TaxID=1982764 RepID=UPI000B40ABD2|nr:hypothetical protein [Streptomyces sp. CS057]OWA25358.1 hypothetical protein B9W61_07920 [Streptomyces sp. CS057]
MSELVNQITALERKVRESDEARQTADRLWDATEDVLDELRSLESSFYTFSSDIDGFIGDNDYPAVERAAYEIQGALAAQHLLPLVRRAMLLLAFREGSSLPALGVMESVPDVAPGDAAHPSLTWGELMRDSERDLASSEESLRKIWCDEGDEAELDEHLHDARFEAIRDRATRAGRQVIALCDYVAQLVPELVRCTERLLVDEALRAVAVLDAAGDEAPKAYKVYEAALSEQYEQSPGSLGVMGEHLMQFESWMRSQL